MRKKLFISVMALALLFAFAQVAMAAYAIRIFSTPYSFGSGGEFRIETGSSGFPFADSLYSQYTRNLANPPSFQTFCIERNETFSSGGSYNAELSNEAKLGGLGGGTPDPVSIGTAYLYSQFALGVLTGYNYTGTQAQRQASANLLQQAIWYLEDEGGSTNTYTALVIAMFASQPGGATGDANGAYGVRAVNIYSGTTPRQDMLTMVPIPAAAWLLGSGLLGLVMIRRRMKK